MSSYGFKLREAEYGHNKDHDNAPQVNYALLCKTDGTPLFGWKYEDSITDVSTVDILVSYIKNLGYSPNCIIMDRGYPSVENISNLFKNKIHFMLAVKLNADWIRKVIDYGREFRNSPDSFIQTETRSYYGSTTECMWVILEKTNKNNKVEYEQYIHICESRRDKYKTTEKGTKVVAQYHCYVHVLFSNDLVSEHTDNLVVKLKNEHLRLLADNKATPLDELCSIFHY
jgi:transposase